MAIPLLYASRKGPAAVGDGPASAAATAAALIRQVAHGAGTIGTEHVHEALRELGVTEPAADI